MPSRLAPEARRTIAFGALVWLSLASLTAWGLWREREQAIDHAKQSAAATVALLEQHTSTTFRAVELSLDDISNRLGGAQLPRHDASMRESMRAPLRGMPYVRALFVIGPDGFIQHDTDYPKTPDVTLADRDYFKAHVADPNLVKGMSAPLQSRSGTGWFVAVTRRIGGPNDFKGVAVAAIQLRYFGDLYARMGEVPGQQIALFHRDGRMLARFPAKDDWVGRSFVQGPLFSELLAKSPNGVAITRGGQLDFERIQAYRTVPDEPLVVGLAHDMDAVLAPWWRAVYSAGAALFLLALLIIAGAALRIRNEAERQRVRERIAEGEKLEALGRLTGSIAHDFANVLDVISNNLSLLSLLPQGRDEKVAGAIDIGKRAVATGTRLTRDLMAFARKREMQLARADLSEAVAQMRPILEQAAGAVAIDTTLGVGLRHCELDYTQLQVTLINLIANARDAMGDQGIVRIRTYNLDRPESAVFGLGSGSSRWVALTVADEGAGMTDEVRRKALEPFFTTKGEKGTGLGLSQVYGFMRQLEGDVAIESKPGVGTQVHLYFRALAH